MDTSTRERVLKEALSWQGTPWRHQGRLKDVGIDCAMYLCEVFYQAGLVPYIDPRPYPADWHFHRSDEKFLQWLEQYGDLVEVPEPADVAVFKFGHCFAHGAIVIEWPLVIHSYNHVGVRTQDATEGRLAGREVKFYRVRS